MKYILTSIIIFSIFIVQICSAVTYQVGSNKTYKTPNALYKANILKNSDVIEIDAQTYSGDDALANWNKDDLIIRGVGGRPHLKADGKYIQGKGIWVLSGNNIKVDNIEFSGAVVPDKNGSGIRIDGTNAHIINCYFHDNESGILTHNKPEGNILVEYCEFNKNGYGDGFSHNIYVGRVNSLTFRYNYSHHAYIGHNLKSRANNNFIYYNRIMDEADGQSSRLIDLPNGGFSILMGNILMQGNNTENGNFVGYGLEGLSNSGPNEMYFINNTCVNKRIAANYFIRADFDTPLIKIANNIFTGGGAMSGGSGIELINNIFEKVIADNFFEDEPNYNYRLTSNSEAIDSGAVINPINIYSLTPDKSYLHKSNFENRFNIDNKIDVGAYEYCNTTYSETSITVCYNYDWEGNTYDQSGTYTTTKVNYGGCDSIMTLNLQINEDTSSTISVESCEQYEWYDEKYTESGRYSRITGNANACDSIIYLDLTIKSGSSSTFSIDTCNPYQWLDEIYYTSGIYQTTLTASNGCDSIVYLDLTISSALSSTFSIDTCDSYLWQGEEYTSTGVYSNIYELNDGCDSIAYLDLTINNSIINNIELQKCNSFLWGSELYNESGTYSKTLETISGCDSLIILSLTIIKIDTTITNTHSNLIANQENAQYQWLDCENDYTNILNANSRTYTPEKIGIFAVEISNLGCKDTSQCILFNTVSVDESSEKADDSNINIFPNPSSGNITISDYKVGYEILDLNGKILKSGKAKTINITRLNAGLYYIRINKNNVLYYLKFIKI